MSKKQKQSKKAAKGSKRTKGLAHPEEEGDTANKSPTAEAPQATPSIPQAEVAIESQQAEPVAGPAAPATESGTAPKWPAVELRRQTSRRVCVCTRLLGVLRASSSPWCLVRRDIC
jgi:hypothetical protein